MVGEIVDHVGHDKRRPRAFFLVPGFPERVHRLWSCCGYHLAVLYHIFCLHPSESQEGRSEASGGNSDWSAHAKIMLPCPRRRSSRNIACLRKGADEREGFGSGLVVFNSQARISGHFGLYQRPDFPIAEPGRKDDEGLPVTLAGFEGVNEGPKRDAYMSRGLLSNLDIRNRTQRACLEASGKIVFQSCLIQLSQFSQAPRRR